MARYRFVNKARVACLTLSLFLAGCKSSDHASNAASWSPVVEQQQSGTDQLLIGLDVLNERVVWAAGTRGTFVRTVDGGRTWEGGTVPGADSLQFRDVHALDANTAYLLSIGNGADSRVYKTTNAGRTWTEQFVNSKEEAFFDCFDFWTDEDGIVFSDAVDGQFPLAATSDGESWSIEMGPDAQHGEGGFAASGTCLVAIGENIALIGTGNAQIARVLRSEDRGRTWTAAETPIVAGEGAGITTLAFRDDVHGVALGGDLAQPEAFTDNVAVTDDGGRTWRLAAHPTFRGAVYGSSYVPKAAILTAVGPNGASYSVDHAASWSPIDTLSYWSTDFASPSAGWAVGPDGRIAKIEFRRTD